MQPVRILHVVTYMGRGGLETMIMNYYRHMDRSKVQFDFLVHRDFRADYDDEIEALGGKIHRLPQLIPWSRKYKNALDAFFCKHTEYKIVHVHQDCLSSVILKSAKKYGVPVRIAHSHNSNQDKNLKYFVKLYYRRQIPANATVLFACGKDAGEWMFRGASFLILNNAIDTAQFVFNPVRKASVRNQLGISQEAFVVGHVGRFDPQKNHTFLLDIFSEIAQKNAHAVLLLVGDGNLRKAMEDKAIALGVYKRVVFTGVRGDVADLLQAMDCFVFPSLYEGLGIVAIEAQAAGLPCLVSDKVPSECDVSPQIQHIPLASETSVWAEYILRNLNKPRIHTKEDISLAGYDIEANAQWLQNYYLEQWNKEA